MKEDIKTYVDIEEIAKEDIICYKVIFTTTYNISFFGKKIKAKTKIEEVPFYFKSLEIAKDFCELHPKYQKYNFVNNNYDNRHVYYTTYKLTVNKNDYFICWRFLTYEDNYHVYFYISENTPIVHTFVTDIKLKNWVNTHSINDITYIDQTTKLSDLVIKIENSNKPINKWRFELVENND